MADNADSNALGRRSKTGALPPPLLVLAAIGPTEAGRGGRVPAVCAPAAALVGPVSATLVETPKLLPLPNELAPGREFCESHTNVGSQPAGGGGREPFAAT